MKVVYVLRYWPTLTETFVVREIAELTRRGVDVVVARIGTRADGTLADGLPAIALWRPSTVDRVRGWRSDPGREPIRRSRAARARALGHWCRRAGVDRLHAHFLGEASAWASLAAEVAGLPWSVTAHAVDLYRPFPTAGRHARAARPLVAVSRAGAAHLSERHGAEAVVIRCGVPVPPEAPPRDPDGWLRVVAVGRWVPKKGLDLLVDAVRRRPRTSLRLVGDAPDTVAGPRVRVGPVPPSAVLHELRAADVFALPCRVAPNGDRDGIPVAMMEAMAAGLPVITTAVSGIPELVDDTVGWLLPPDDAGALDAALESASQPAEARARGAAGRHRILTEGWTVERQVDELLSAWGEG